MPKNRTNRLLIGDTLYELTEAYRNGARACRAETPFWANPHRDGSQRHADWAAGHDNEAAGHHRISVTLDAIEAAPAGLELVAPEEEELAAEPAPPRYQVFTRAHDEIVRADDLLDADPERKAHALHLRDQLSLSGGGFWDARDRREAGEMLERLSGDLKEISPSRPLIFLLDNSGSMRGRPMAGLVTLMGEIGELLDRSGHPFEVLGFTTRTWKGGRSREDWIMAGRPQRPGRLCDLRHIIYRDASDPWVRDPLSLMLAEGALKENVDGEALLWAAERGRRLGGATIVHVMDGAPVDDSTLSANPADYLERHMAEVYRSIGEDPDLTLTRVELKRDPETGLHIMARDLSDGVLAALRGSFTEPCGPTGP